MPNKFQIQKHKDNSQKRKLIYWMCYWHTDRMCYYLYWQNSGEYIDRHGFEGCQRQTSRIEDLIMSNPLPWCHQLSIWFNILAQSSGTGLKDLFDGLIDTLSLVASIFWCWNVRTFMPYCRHKVWRLDMQRK